MNEITRYNLIVIGSGPGGYVAAIRAAQLGMKTEVVERDQPGGICLNWGCIPTKALLKSASLYESIKKGDAFGLKIEGASFDLEEIVKRSRDVSGNIVKGVEYLLKKHNVELIKGDASLASANTVLVNTGADSAVLEADNIIIASGARTRQLPGMELDGERIISSKEAMTLKTLPGKLAIIGAGPIGLEFAYFFQALGSQVTILEAMDRILPVEDIDVSKIVARSFKRRKVKIETSAQVEHIERDGDMVHIKYESKGKSKSLDADIAIVAIGVSPNVETLALDKVGVDTYKSGISVNESMQTSIPSIYAIGDVNGPPWLAHVASAEGVHAVEYIAGKNPAAIDYDAVPGCIYCEPQAASVGYSEERAQKAGIEYTKGEFSFKASGRAIASGHTDGMVKLLFDKEHGALIGGHIVGGEATEMIHELVLAVSRKNTAEDIGRAIHAHPTYGESIMEAALDALGERIHGV
jgi:dihydrolipoyl dehydrogenase